jgi:hypothetical protein
VIDPRHIGAALLDKLCQYKGFDDLIDSIDKEDLREIQIELAHVAMAQVMKWERSSVPLESDDGEV